VREAARAAEAAQAAAADEQAAAAAAGGRLRDREVRGRRAVRACTLPGRPAAAPC
jgi:hypothetical protein